MSVRPPIWLDNYAPGYVMFTFHSDEIASIGIAYFEHWDRLSSIRVSHALIVAGPDCGIEARAKGGVRFCALNDLFSDPYCAVFLRKPRFYTPDLGQRIVDAAQVRIGCGYDWRLDVGHGMVDTMAGHWLLSDAAEMRVLRWCNDPSKFMCSELVCTALADQRELRGRGCLARPAYSNNPQRVFEDGAVFESWKGQNPVPTI